MEDATGGAGQRSESTQDVELSEGEVGACDKAQLTLRVAPVLQ